MADLTDLINLGPRSQEWLHAVGIRRLEDLERLAALLGRERFPAASANLLYALEGALRDVRWDYVPVDVHRDLRRQAGWWTGRAAAGCLRSAGAATARDAAAAAA